MRPQTALALLCCASLVGLVPAPAAAQQGAEKAADVEQAKALFNAGAQAYEAGRYTAALEAFQASYKKAPRPTIVFSMAQAYKRQYFIDKKLENLQEAIRNYRLYLDQVPQGGRRADAAASLNELEIVATRLGLNDKAADPAPSPPPSDTKLKTRVTVTSPTPGARVSLDGRAPVEVPLLEEVTPGKHKVKISADGYVDVVRDIVAVEQDLVALDQELREKPARVEIKAPAGAQVSVDGRFVGTMPLPPMDIAAGKRFIAITHNGYKAYGRELDLARGGSQRVDVALKRTAQRRWSYAFFTASVLSGAVGVGASLVALGYEGQARELADEHEAKGLNAAQFVQFRQHVDDRDKFRGAAVASFAFGAGLGLVGAALYAFDQPAQALPPARDDKKPASPSSPTLDIAAAPILSPTFAGAGLVGRF
jgi:tetratricopeptide (TPR) repeat protein